MAARAGVRGLSADEIQAIRDGLGAGRRPRVMFTESAGQVAGQIGQVVSLLDPADSDEWMVVRVGRDELPFSPADLQVAARGAVARKAASPPVAVKAEPEFVLDKPVKPARKAVAAAKAPEPAANGTAPNGTAANGTAANGTAANGTAANGNAAKGTAVTAAVSRGGPTPAAEPEAARRTGGVPVPRKAAGRSARPKAPAGLTVTLSYAGGEWTVAATQGAKSLARPYAVRPVEALRMVSLVDVPGVQEAVEQIMSAERAEAEQQAERLRAELAEIEARLAELRDAG
jgi:hypothetical protein